MYPNRHSASSFVPSTNHHTGAPGCRQNAHAYALLLFWFSSVKFAASFMQSRHSSAQKPTATVLPERGAGTKSSFVHRHVLNTPPASVRPARICTCMCTRGWAYDKDLHRHWGGALTEYVRLAWNAHFPNSLRRSSPWTCRARGIKAGIGLLPAPLR
eukprot:196562-Chlamydomonas_euryale.AAC.1